MRFSTLILGSLFTMLCWHSKAQDFANPLNIPMVLSGNFGEIRSNHFHTGLDIKTQGREGLPVFCIDEGEIVRVKVSPYGYGKALYIKHPGGYTSVYAHLSSFSPEVEAYIKEEQYKAKSYDVNAYPPAGKFKFSKGQEIAKSGNSGSSGGPHLHFEVRDSRTEEPINPQTLGFKISDNVKPSIYGLSVYALNENSHVNQKDYDNFSMGGSYGSYALKEEDAITAHGDIGLAVHSIDRYDAANNKCGIYKVVLKVNDQVQYSAVFDRLNFETNRYMNAHIDYNLFKKYRKHYHRLFKTENNPLDIYKTLINNGALDCRKDESLNCKLEISDFEGNLSTLNFQIKSQATPYKRASTHNPNQHKVNALSPFEWKGSYSSVSIPAKTLYFSDELEFREFEHNGLPALQVGDEYTGAQNSFSLALKIPESIPNELHSKILLGKIAANNRVQADNAGEVKQGWFYAKNREFGTYTLIIDTVNPTIKPIGMWEGKELRNGNKIRFIIRDGQSGVNEYQLYIDGNWALLEYDYRKAAVVYEFDAGRVSPGDHTLKIVISDKVGNEESLEYNFKSY